MQLQEFVSTNLATIYQIGKSTKVRESDAQSWQTKIFALYAVSLRCCSFLQLLPYEIKSNGNDETQSE